VLEDDPWEAKGRLEVELWREGEAEELSKGGKDV
jgi:hypothetical protein